MSEGAPKKPGPQKRGPKTEAAVREVSTAIQPNAPSPKAILKARRPERFSDSRLTVSPRLARTLLEYHLDSLTCPIRRR